MLFTRGGEVKPFPTLRAVQASVLRGEVICQVEGGWSLALRSSVSAVVRMPTHPYRGDHRHWAALSPAHHQFPSPTSTGGEGNLSNTLTPQTRHKKSFMSKIYIYILSKSLQNSSTGSGHCEPAADSALVAALNISAVSKCWR